ncbi:hypothetical protein [Agarivorans sp. OAG1]|uniref:hypothetical protein n=1 Tax=Agarivorans sp. OAG1 TaxID=3082387 RepID=UPI0030CA782D
MSLLAFVASGGLTAGCVADENKTSTVQAYAMEVVHTFTHHYSDTHVAFFLYNPETDLPCPRVALHNQQAGSAITSKTLCVFPDRQGRLFDARTDVSFIDYDMVVLNDQGVSFTADVSLRESDAFLLDCTLPIEPFKLGLLECHLREISLAN